MRQILMKFFFEKQVFEKKFNFKKHDFEEKKFF